MAISKEDKADVKNAMGKALANKVGKVTRDKVDHGNKEFKERADRLVGKDTFAQFRSYKKKH